VLRRMRHQEHMRTVWTHYGPTRIWHKDTLSSPHLPQDPATTKGDYGPDGAAGAWAKPPHAGASRDYGQAGAADAAAYSAGAAAVHSRPDGAADGLTRSTLWHAEDTTTRPSWSGPTRQSDALDSQSSSTCQLVTRPGQGIVMTSRRFYLCDASVLITFGAEHFSATA
jgi:hypothetical protein